MSPNPSVVEALSSISAIEFERQTKIEKIALQIAQSGSVATWERVALGLTGSAEAYNRFKDIDERLSANVHGPAMLVPDKDYDSEGLYQVNFFRPLGGLIGHVDPDAGFGRISIPVSDMWRTSVNRWRSFEKLEGNAHILRLPDQSDEEDMAFQQVMRRPLDNGDYRTPGKRMDQPINYTLYPPAGKLYVGLS